MFGKGGPSGVYLTADIASVELYNPKPLVWHATIYPFVILYAVWFGYWCNVLGFTEYLELGLIGTAVIGVSQILACLSCHWSVAFRCWATCSKVYVITNSFSAHLE